MSKGLKRIEVKEKNVRMCALHTYGSSGRTAFPN